MDWQTTREQLAEQGWTFTPDMSHPHNKDLGYYVAHLNDSAYGWYCHPQHNLFCRPEGDSCPRWMAGQMRARLLAMR